jgi:hypothetical protein
MFLRSVTDDCSVRSQEIRISVQTSQGISIKITRIIWSASCSYIEHLSLKRFSVSNFGAQTTVAGISTGYLISPEQSNAEQA